LRSKIAGAIETQEGNVIFCRRSPGREADAIRRWREALPEGVDLRVARDDLAPHEADEPMALLDPIHRHLPAEWNHENLAYLLGRLTDGQRIVWLTSVMEGDVMNGGFDAYLGSVSGDFAPQTLDALRALGAEQHADVLASALAAFGSATFPATDAERCDLLAADPAIGKRLSELDAAYYAADEHRMLREYGQAYVRAHPEHFFR
jgi:hypothetical protein